MFHLSNMYKLLFANVFLVSTKKEFVLIWNDPGMIEGIGVSLSIILIITLIRHELPSPKISLSSPVIIGKLAVFSGMPVR